MGEGDNIPKEKYTRLNLLRKSAVWPWFLVALFCAILFVIIVRQRSRIQNIEAENTNISQALTDTVRIYRDKEGKQIATITAFQTSRKKDFLKIKSNDSVIKRLQNLVSDYGNKLGSGTATTFNTSTHAIARSTTIVTPGDTVLRHDTAFVFPTYSSKFALGKWVTGNTVANRDSIIVSLKTYNEYDVIVAESEGGLFKKPKVYADVITHSPYDDINQIRAFKVAVPPQKKLGLGFSLGYGLSASGAVIYIGVGLNYNLIRLK